MLMFEVDLLVLLLHFYYKGLTNSCHKFLDSAPIQIRRHLQPTPYLGFDNINAYSFKLTVMSKFRVKNVTPSPLKVRRDSWTSPLICL